MQIVRTHFETEYKKYTFPDKPYFSCIKGFLHSYCLKVLLILASACNSNSLVRFSTVHLHKCGKANCNVTLGLFYFIAPANSHAHTLPVHCCITRLS